MTLVQDKYGNKFETQEDVSFAEKMLAHARYNMRAVDEEFWQREVRRLTPAPLPPLFKEPEPLNDEQLEDWLNQSAYADQFAY